MQAGAQPGAAPPGNGISNGLAPLPVPPPGFRDSPALGPRSVSLAYALESEKATAHQAQAWKVWLVAGDCFLIGLAPVLVHMSKVDGKFPFHPVSINLLVEVAKTLFASAVLAIYGTGRTRVPLHRSARLFIASAWHNRLLAIPAALYAVNNSLKFAMQLFFKPTTAKMLGNLKILVIAVLMKAVMQRTFNVFQWEALVLLVAGITVNQLHDCSKSGAEDVIGTSAALCTLGSITVPSLASVYNEFALKKHMDTSVHEQNFFLYFFGTLFNLVGVLGVMATSRLSWRAVFHGHSKVTMLLVVNNALQGILSSFFFKYADTILKKYSSTLATVFTGLMSAALFGHTLTLNFLIGVTIIFISMHQFFSQGGVKGAVALEKSKGHGGAAEGAPAELGLGSVSAALRPLRFSGHSPSSEHMAVEGDAHVASISSAVADMESGAGGAGNLSARRPLLPW